MSLLGRLALLFIGVPLLELFILIQVGQWIGLWPTIGLVVLTGFLGAALARLEGLRTIWSIRGELARGRLPGKALFDGLAILVGGALLLTPGILTDLVGFSFLLPPTRRFLMRRVRRRLESGLRAGTIRVTQFSGFPQGRGWAWAGSPGSDKPGGGMEGDPLPGEEGPDRGQPGEIVVESEELDPR